MGQSTAPQKPYAVVGDVSNLAYSFASQLDSGELLTGTPAVVEQTTSDLAFANIAVNSAELTINDKTVAIGMAVQCKVSGQLVANTPYTLKVTVTTDATPAQTKVRYCEFRVEA